MRPTPTMPTKSAPRSSSCAAAPSRWRGALQGALLALLVLQPAPAGAAEAVRVAVLPFQVVKVAPAWEAYGPGLADALSTALSNTPPFVVSQPLRLQHVLKALKPGP